MEWEKYAYCLGLPTEWFFEYYLKSEANAQLMDELCEICPVKSFCLEAGVQSKSTGLWGGQYLMDGKVDYMKNKHKNVHTS